MAPAALSSRWISAQRIHTFSPKQTRHFARQDGERNFAAGAKLEWLTVKADFTNLKAYSKKTAIIGRICEPCW